jgi:Holliday junction resolvasome RuvABC ATP-dependent DNA helicase subunit
MQTQNEKLFFLEGEVPPARLRVWLTNPDNQKSAYSKFIGNRKAIKRLGRISADALANRNHVARELAVALLGPSSAGKTTLARLHAQVLGLPFVEIGPASVRTADRLLDLIGKATQEAGYPLVEVKKDNHYFLPPVVVFLDEVHAFNPHFFQLLLKAVEYNDHMLETEDGRTADTYNVHWVTATTDRGDLPTQFDNRFMQIPLNLYSKEEVGQIILAKHPQIGDDAAKLVAHYNSRVPREADAFAREMLLEARLSPGQSWVDVAKRIAEDREIDEHGMTLQRVRILTALGQRPVSEERLAQVAGCKVKELNKHVLPALTSFPDGEEPMVVVTTKGYTITAKGLEELNKRGIEHSGFHAAA